MGIETEVLKQHLQYGPYKTKRGAENALKRRKEHWRRLGFKHPPKGASLYNKEGNYMFRPWPTSDMDEKTRNKVAKLMHNTPDHVTFRIEEKTLSKKEVSVSQG